MFYNSSFLQYPVIYLSVCYFFDYQEKYTLHIFLPYVRLYRGQSVDSVILSEYNGNIFFPILNNLILRNYPLESFNMKRLINWLLVAALLFGTVTISACNNAEETRLIPDVDFSSSPYKHINNGGITDNPVLPYNIDAITGATMTVEGPAVAVSIPLSVRELENRNGGLVRGIYSDSSGSHSYEGMDLYFLLNEMVEGDNGIILTDSAYRIQLKNSNRSTISEFTLEEVSRAHNDGKPIILAYGIGTVSGDKIVPFVFDSANDGEHSLGYDTDLKNDDGCIKLVYDLKNYGNNKDYKTFSNVAYVYVCEETEPGFKHTSSEAFNTSRYTDYILAFRGSALGYEADLTVSQLEDLVVYGNDGKVVENGIGYSDEYSLANNAYWYVNEYEGLDLYKLLIYLGMDDAETMGLQKARTTLVHFLAADGVASNEVFSVDTLSYPDAFGFYNKNAADMNDGAYVPTNADLVDTGYPVLMAYGVNHYPYTIQKTDPSYLSGLANNGGPFRVVFGKTQYNHANGSNQVQYLSEVTIGEDVMYNTHKYTDNDALKSLSGDTVLINVHGEDGVSLIDRTMTVGEIEDLIYGEDIDKHTKKAARVKDLYEIPCGDGFETDIFEGIGLEYFMMEILGLPGTNGTVTFSNGSDSITIQLDELFAEGYNTALSREGLISVLAFAKNGAPMVRTSGDDGYTSSIGLKPFLPSDPSEYKVENFGGPIALLIPSSDDSSCSAEVLYDINSITVDLLPDAYAHLAAPYSDLRGETVLIGGEGLDRDKRYSVEELEMKQRHARTVSCSIDGTDVRYRGIPVYELFTDIGIKNNAGDVTIRTVSGDSTCISLSLIKRTYSGAGGNDVCAVLAYGIGTDMNDRLAGLPLVSSVFSAGYDTAAGNDGGPLTLIIPGEDGTAVCIPCVVSIEVSANDVDTWSHSMSDVYSDFTDAPFTLTIRNEENEWTYDFTLSQLEKMKDIIVRDRYTVLDVGECEGLDIWKFIKKVAGDTEGIDDPISITAYASDGYKNDLLSVFSMDGFRFGVPDENGDRKKLILCYAINGYPLVDEESHEGYTGLAGNGAGPMRVIAETNQGASVKYCNKIVVTLKGSGIIDIAVDPS